MPPVPSNRMMWYRDPKSDPTASGPVWRGREGWAAPVGASGGSATPRPVAVGASVAARPAPAAPVGASGPITPAAPVGASEPMNGPTPVFVRASGSLGLALPAAGDVGASAFVTSAVGASSSEKPQTGQ